MSMIRVNASGPQTTLVRVLNLTTRAIGVEIAFSGAALTAAEAATLRRITITITPTRDEENTPDENEDEGAEPPARR